MCPSPVVVVQRVLDIVVVVVVVQRVLHTVVIVVVVLRAFHTVIVVVQSALQTAPPARLTAPSMRPRAPRVSKTEMDSTTTQ